MTIRGFLNIVELRTKIVSVSGFAVGTSYALLTPRSIDPAVAIIYFAAVVILDMATTGFNSFFDFYTGVDRKGTNRETDKVIVRGEVTGGHAALVAFALFAAAAVLGVILAWLASAWVIPIGAACMMVGFLYNAGPLPISRTPLGEVFAGGFLGWVLITLTIFVETGEIRRAELLVGLPSTALVASILTVNNTCDLETDRAAGRKTLSVLFGKRFGAALIYLFGLAGFMGTAVLAEYGPLPRLVVPGILIAALVSVPQYLRMHLRGYSAETKGPSMQSIVRIFAFFSVGLVIPILIHAAGWAPPPPS